MLYYIRFDEFKRRKKKNGNGPNSRYFWAFYNKERRGWDWSLCIKESHGKLPGEYHYWNDPWNVEKAT